MGLQDVDATTLWLFQEAVDRGTAGPSTTQALIHAVIDRDAEIAALRTEVERQSHAAQGPHDRECSCSICDSRERHENRVEIARLRAALAAGPARLRVMKEGDAPINILIEGFAVEVEAAQEAATKEGK